MKKYMYIGITAIVIISCIIITLHVNTKVKTKVESIPDDTTEEQDVYTDDIANVGSTDAYFDDDENFGVSDDVTVIESDYVNPEIAAHESDAHLLQNTEEYTAFLNNNNIKSKSVLYIDYENNDTEDLYTYGLKNTDTVFNIESDANGDIISISNLHNKYTNDELFVKYKNGDKIDKVKFYSVVPLSYDKKYYVVYNTKKDMIYVYNLDNKKDKLYSYNPNTSVVKKYF